MARPATSNDPGGYVGGYDFGYDVAGPPFPASFRSSIPTIPPQDGGPEFPPLPPGYAFAGDPCQPQRTDSEVYRRAVHLGLITPTAVPASDGVAIDALQRAAAAQLQGDAVTHRFQRTQIAPASADYDHGGFSQGFG